MLRFNASSDVAFGKRDVELRRDFLPGGRGLVSRNDRIDLFGYPGSQVETDRATGRPGFYFFIFAFLTLLYFVAIKSSGRAGAESPVRAYRIGAHLVARGAHMFGGFGNVERVGCFPYLFRQVAENTCLLAIGGFHACYRARVATRRNYLTVLPLPGPFQVTEGPSMPLSSAMDDGTPQGGSAATNHATQHVLLTGKAIDHESRLDRIEANIPDGGGVRNALVKLTGDDWLDSPSALGWRALREWTSPSESDIANKRVWTATGTNAAAWRAVPVGDKTLPVSIADPDPDSTEGKWLKSVDGHASWETLVFPSVRSVTDPDGIADGWVLTKYSVGLVDSFDWAAPADGLPSGGTDGDVVTLVSGTPAWAAPASGLPSGGADGKIIEHDGIAAYWGRRITVSTSAPSGGDDGDLWFQV
jgi:hypothetical protein